MSENKNNETATKIPYMCPMMNYHTYPFGEYMWQRNPSVSEGMCRSMPVCCPMCGSFLPMGGFMGCAGGYPMGENVPFPECSG